MLARLDAELKGLSPSYFALVMATGIIAIAAELLDLRPIAVALFVISVCAYVVLWALTGLRLARHRSELVADLISHERGFGFMTIVAGTCVLGSEMIVIADRIGIATALLAIGGVLWLLLTYTIFTAVGYWRWSPPSRSPCCWRCWPRTGTRRCGWMRTSSPSRCGSGAGCSTSGSSP